MWFFSRESIILNYFVTSLLNISVSSLLGWCRHGLTYWQTLGNPPVLALRIDSPSHAQMNKQRHKTWSFCFKYYILPKSNKIQRQMGGIFHLWQFLLDQIAHGRWPGIKKWRHVNKWKPWSFQLHCAVNPYFSVTKWKMHLLNTW